MAIVATLISSEIPTESLQSLAFFVSLLLCSLEHSQWGNHSLIWPFGLADEPGDEQSMSRVITDFVLNTRYCYNSNYSSVRLSDWKLFVEFIGPRAIIGPIMALDWPDIRLQQKIRILIRFLWKTPEKPAAKQRWTTLRMSRPLVVGSHLQVTWWGLNQRKGIKICKEW